MNENKEYQYKDIKNSLEKILLKLNVLWGKKNNTNMLYEIQPLIKIYKFLGFVKISFKTHFLHTLGKKNLPSKNLTHNLH